MVIVNTNVYVRTLLGRGSDDVVITLAAFGGGSMAARSRCPRFSIASTTDGSWSQRRCSWS
jgi:hypothetical protein